jgi:SAM-dependent methyltransferase
MLVVEVGAQTKWFVEYGARHVILLDLAHSIDGVVQHNLVGLENVDVVQCSIDSPPLRDESINGIVYCHNVIQHTPSVGKTAQALFDLTAPGGEFVFNCYQLNDQGLLRWIRWHLIYKPLRAFLSHMPFWFILSYAKIMASLRLVPVLGELLEKMLLVGQGDVPIIQGESIFSRLKRRFKAASLNTFDAYGAHKYQHHKKDEEIQKLLNELQPDPFKIMNREKYFLHPTPIGCALRVFK